MRVSDFKNLINELPHLNQSFTIKKSVWKNDSQSELIRQIFDDNNTITINRFDLYNSTFNLPIFIIKTLMWGYPSKGRGNNIDTLLNDSNFNKLVKMLEGFEQSNINFSQIEKAKKELNGIGISTITKFLYFLNTSIDGNRAIILDRKIIDILHSGQFEEFNSLKSITYDNAFKLYPIYLTIINDLSRKLMVDAGQIELFLFIFGKSLSELKGEECYDEDLID